MSHIRLLGGFSLTEPVYAPTSFGSRRLLAYLALKPTAITRASIAGTLWPEANDHRAGLSLRSTLTRMDPAHRLLLDIGPTTLGLSRDVEVDLHSSHRLAVRLLPIDLTPSLSDISISAVAALSEELLPDWYDEWVVAAAEDWRALRMNGLEVQTRELLKRRRLPEAGVAARAAIAVEPLRESAQAALIRVHLAEGNPSEALRVYRRYSVLLDGALGLAPTIALAALIRDHDTSDS
ncbi:AfsR/SARP family transcriptional regulator [Subtercola boreus]|uniref:Bacterial transcriptional activator domain-containing protein n=1 Tax=Subtercola boreus TaxID=120213 RepID=A0A3E0W7J5_9MICO|nr:BTAD domain-containing putative transcriptional regulator [Subtercola boreus]RFA17980.1 hypothetical protein B7R24_15075 [Subtercola boreus]RFA18362.1 hypothetical protein B7R23_15110 [Subtercola boreus]RFA24891.1 hypothetical protein B7R25_15105 [Subtercola boreus]